MSSVMVSPSHQVAAVFGSPTERHIELIPTGDLGQTDHVLSSAIYQCRKRRLANDIDASAYKLKALSRKIHHPWRLCDPSVEPGFDRMPVRGNDVSGLCCH